MIKANNTQFSDQSEKAVVPKVEFKKISTLTSVNSDDNVLLLSNPSQTFHTSVNSYSPAWIHFNKKLALIFLIVILSLLAITVLVILVTLENHGLELQGKRFQGSNSRKELLLNNFWQISGSKVISGVFVYVGENVSDVIRNFKRTTGVFPGVISTHLPRSNAAPTEWNSFIAEVIYYWNNNYLVRIYWWGRCPLYLIDDFTDNTANVDEKWNDLVEDGGRKNKIWKDQLELIAPYLKQLQNAGVIAIIDIFPVSNSKAFIWRGRPGVNGTVKLYKITHDYLTERHNLTSFLWTWSLATDNITQCDEYWPGREYVDVASVTMLHKKGLSEIEYQKLIDVVGDKPISMEDWYGVPTLQLLTDQPRWSWFTTSEISRSTSEIGTIFNSSTVIHRGDIDFFNQKL